MAQMDKQVEQYLEKAVVFIVDRNSASRRRLAKVIAQMGATSININRFSELTEAEDALSEIRPNIVFCDFHVGHFSGLDFFQRVRDTYPEAHDNLYILVTSNVSQSAVAKAAEEDVDAYIIKPFTHKAIVQTVSEAIKDKLNPDEYHLSIAKGKELLFDGQFEAAMKIFEQSIPLSETPTLAHYYYGQAKKFLEVYVDAEKSYQQGLNYNKIHFKCQTGLYDLFMKEKKYNQAYDVLKNISHYFPPNEERLMNLIKLAVLTGKILDVPSFYQTFLQLDTKSPMVSRYMCAGLFVAGKLLINKKKNSQAIQAFDNLTISSAGNKKFLWKVVETLVENGLQEHLAKVMPRFSPEDYSSPEYRLACYFLHYPLSDANRTIREGLDLFNENIKHPYAYKLFIQAMIMSGQQDKALSWIEEALSLWPSKKGVFMALKKTVNSSEAA